MYVVTSPAVQFAAVKLPNVPFGDGKKNVPCLQDIDFETVIVRISDVSFLTSYALGYGET